MPRCCVPVCLLLPNLQLAAVCAAAVIRIVKVAVLVEDESCAARGNVDPQTFFGSSKFGFSLIWGLSPENGFGFC